MAKPALNAMTNALAAVAMLALLVAPLAVTGQVGQNEWWCRAPRGSRGEDPNLDYYVGYTTYPNIAFTGPAANEFPWIDDGDCYPATDCPGMCYGDDACVGFSFKTVAGGKKSCFIYHYIDVSASVPDSGAMSGVRWQSPGTPEPAPEPEPSPSPSPEPEPSPSPEPSSSPEPSPSPSPSPSPPPSPSPSPPPSPSPSPAPPPPPVSVCTLESGKRYYGGTFVSGTEADHILPPAGEPYPYIHSDAQGCQARCASTSGCGTFVYYAPGQSCWLLTTAYVGFAADGAFSSGACGAALPPPPPVAAPGCILESGKRYYGGTFVSGTEADHIMPAPGTPYPYTEPDAPACQARCAGTSGCVTYVYHALGKGCWLFRTPFSGYAADGAFSSGSCGVRLATDSRQKWVKCAESPEWKCWGTTVEADASKFIQTYSSKNGGGVQLRLFDTGLCLDIWGGMTGTLVNPYTCSDPADPADNELWRAAGSQALTTAYGSTAGGCLVWGADQLTAVTHTGAPAAECPAWELV